MADKGSGDTSITANAQSFLELVRSILPRLDYNGMHTRLEDGPKLRRKISAEPSHGAGKKDGRLKRVANLCRVLRCGQMRRQQVQKSMDSSSHPHSQERYRRLGLVSFGSKDGIELSGYLKDSDN